MIRIIAIALLIGTAPALAAVALPDRGPLPTEIVDTALDDSPLVTEAMARLRQLLGTDKVSVVPLDPPRLALVG